MDYLRHWKNFRHPK
uniref:Uncharacterized protein n=1 Tax=Rhizophora mucronata TaxID=61149 RepID=A0A2P2Q1Y2_RHIMU